MKPPYRDIGAFEDRAPLYDRGWRGRMHHVIAERTGALSLSITHAPRRILDVGCGTGHLLRLLAMECPDANELWGLDPAPSMIDVAVASSDDPRLAFSIGVAEDMPYPDAVFDLIVSTTSFDHWTDQQAGLRECARVLVPGGRLVVCDQFSSWLTPTLLVGRRGKARSRRRAERLLDAARFRSMAWHDLYAMIIKAVTATR